MINPAHHLKFVAKTFAGLEEILCAELQYLGASEPVILKRGVAFKGDVELLYKLNYLSRLALRILLVIDEFDCSNEVDFYHHLHSIEWWKYMDINKKLAVDGTIFNSFFSNSHYAVLKTKDAIVDAFRDKFGNRPDIDIKSPDLRVNLHIAGNHCTLSLDSSGNTLNQRNYRKKSVEAPINEVTAAGLIQLSKWDKRSPFVDFMCGSGTLLIEAAMLTGNIPSGYYRNDFGFFHWPDFNKDLWAGIKAEADSQIAETDTEIKGCDISGENYDVAAYNIRQAKLHHDIKIENCDFRELIPPVPPGTLITNPPYGERLKPDDLLSLYKSLGNTLKSKYTGYTAWIISSDSEAIKNIGLKPSKKFFLYNGPIECRFHGFELYKGNRNATRQT